jgi:hypothetical protein
MDEYSITYQFILFLYALVLQLLSHSPVCNTWRNGCYFLCRTRNSSQTGFPIHTRNPCILSILPCVRSKSVLKLTGTVDVNRNIICQGYNGLFIGCVCLCVCVYVLVQSSPDRCICHWSDWCDYTNFRSKWESFCCNYYECQ